MRQRQARLFLFNNSKIPLETEFLLLFVIKKLMLERKSNTIFMQCAVKHLKCVCIRNVSGINSGNALFLESNEAWKVLKILEMSRTLAAVDWLTSRTKLDHIEQFVGVHVAHASISICASTMFEQHYDYHHFRHAISQITHLTLRSLYIFDSCKYTNSNFVPVIGKSHN